MSSDYRKPSGEPEEEMSVELELEDGSKVNCAVITILEVEERTTSYSFRWTNPGTTRTERSGSTAIRKTKRIPMRNLSFATLKTTRNMRSWRTPLTNIWTTVSLTS